MNKKLALVGSPVTRALRSVCRNSRCCRAGYEWMNDLHWSSRASPATKTTTRAGVVEGGGQWFRESTASCSVATLLCWEIWSNMVVFRKNWSQYVVEVIDLLDGLLGGSSDRYIAQWWWWWGMQYLLAASLRYDTYLLTLRLMSGVPFSGFN